MELPSVKSEVKDTDEDFVVQEYDVFLTHNLESKLALFQVAIELNNLYSHSAVSC
jgi:hypothetical protein